MTSARGGQSISHTGAGKGDPAPTASGEVARPLPTGPELRGRSVTMRDIAEKLGVSIKAVSHAVNERPKVGPRTGGRVQQASRELNYRPQVGAREVRTGTSAWGTLATPPPAGPHC